MKYWSLYNREEKLRIDDLSIKQVKVILLAISSRRLADWYACQRGQIGWLPLTQVKEFRQEVEEIRTPTEPMQMAAGAEPGGGPAPRRPAFELHVVDDSKSVPTLVVDAKSIKERRNARRYARHLKFACAVEDQLFTCETNDVSMTGFSLTEELPHWVPKVFKAELSLNNHSTSILCERVSDKKIKIASADNWDLLRRWIVNF